MTAVIDLDGRRDDEVHETLIAAAGEDRDPGPLGAIQDRRDLEAARGNYRTAMELHRLLQASRDTSEPEVE